ncbi:MAG: biopolymer transporter ExbD [Planctomycetota bacterium]
MGSRNLWGNGSSIGRSRDEGDQDIDLTSAIDVVFLLLIFFVLTSAIAVQSKIAIPPARHGKGVDPTKSTIVTLLAPRRKGEDSRILLGDRSDGPNNSLEEVEREIEKGIAGGKTQVIIQAERTVPHRDVLEVARIVGAKDHGVLYIAVQELP